MTLHIVSFNVPYPADYGGVIDVFYRLKALHSLGVDIHLHTFTYGRPQAPELEQYCSEVTYYQRHTGLLSALSTKPYIVQSRDNSLLIENLKKDNAPVFLEGLHCCSVLEAIDGQRVMVRAHNVEHDYYSNLASVETNPLRRLYLRTDARRLRRYEPVLLKAGTVFAVTEADAAHFRSIGCRDVVLMPSSHADDEVSSLPGRGDYALYHADLSVGENIDAVRYLADQVFSRSDSRLVVAGRNPSPLIYKTVGKYSNISVVPNPDEATMQSLITNAQVLILVTSLPTGLKLKLLNSIYAGRHCLVNSAMVAGTQLDKLCTVANTPDEQLAALQSLMQTPFTEEDIQRRSALLGNLYSNQSNARKILSRIEPR